MRLAKVAIIAGVLLFLVACQPPEWDDVPMGWTLDGEPPGGQEEFDVAVNTVREMGPNGEVPADWIQGGTVQFAPVIGGDPRYAGMWLGQYPPRSPYFAVATVRHTSPDDPGTPVTKIEQTALVHEIGHYLWTRYGLTNLTHPPEFIAWVNAVNREVARRLGR